MGLLTLTIIPAFQLTIANFVLFEIGAILGMFITANLALDLLREALQFLRISITRDSDPLTYLMYFIVLLGTVGSGAGLVRLKMYFSQRRNRVHEV